MLKKIIIVGGNVRSLVDNRGELIKDLKKNNVEVIGVVPKKDFNESIEKLNIKYYKIPLDRTSLNPFKSLIAIKSLHKIFKNENPDYILSYNLKPVIFGSIAGGLAGINKIYSIITGLGYVFSGRSFKQLMLQIIVSVLYFFSLHFNKKVFFQNPDDKNMFEKRKLISKNKTVLINGSGVDIKYYYKSKNVVDNKQIVFLFMARLIEDKGINEYIEAAKKIQDEYFDIKPIFNVLGPIEDLPTSVNKETILKLDKEEVINYQGSVKDVRPYIKNCNVFVLPSKYREGTPRAILEAMSMKKPVITTDSPGCKETVKSGINGFLVEPGNVKQLVDKIKWFIKNKNKIQEMSEKSREIAEDKYDVKKVNETIIKNLNL